ncbi:MAG TPA: YcnI family protein [Limnochordia bacterium]|nr:YcnI family protein [Limnochordia bacterium]
MQRPSNLDRIGPALRQAAISAGLAGALVLALAGVGLAHVTVWPKASTVGAWEKYTLRVPTERDVPTVSVTLRMPAGVEFEQYRPLPGWSVTTKKDAQHRVTLVTWTATDGGLAPGQFQEFEFVAKNPAAPGAVAWDAFQTYKGGEIVEWTGNEGSQTPHSLTEITAK